MKTIRKRHSVGRRGVLVIIVVALLAGGSAFALWPKDTNRPSNKELTKNADETSAVDKEQATQNNDEAGNETAKLPSKTSSHNQTTPPEKSSPSNTTSENNKKPEAPRITRAEQTDNTIKVTALLESSSSGYCELRLSKANYQTVVRKTNVVVGPSYYACGFNVPRDKMPASGQWKAVVVHHTNGASANSDSKTVEVN